VKRRDLKGKEIFKLNKQGGNRRQRSVQLLKSFKGWKEKLFELILCSSIIIVDF